MPETVRNAAHWIEEHARARGEALAVADAERRLDYRALAERVRRCAAVLAANGVVPGERVALLLENRSAYLEAVFAAAHLGAIAVPLNARLTPHELRGLLADCQPRLLLAEPDGPDPGGVARLEAGQAYEAALAEAAPHAAPPADVSPEDPMILMYTSGTTGTPKGALLPHRKTHYNARNAGEFFGLQPEDRVLVALPLFHSFGLKILSLPTLFVGGAVFLQRRFEANQVWKSVERERISFFGGVPTMFQRLLDALNRRPWDTASLRFLFTAGAAIPVELVRAYQERGLVLKQGFGQTETSILCCLEARDALRKAGSVGRPVRHAELRLIRPASLAGPVAGWEDCAVGEPGEIAVRGPITMTGYWRDPEASAEVLRDGWLRTGDLATVDHEGFYTLVGRARELYISGGENVYPAEVEAAYLAHPAVREIAVVGVPDPEWGEAGHAYCVFEPGQAPDEAALRAWGAERLAGFKLPRRFTAVAALPRTESGKVMKHRLGGP